MSFANSHWILEYMDMKWIDKAKWDTIYGHTAKGAMVLMSIGRAIWRSCKEDQSRNYVFENAPQLSNGLFGCKYLEISCFEHLKNLQKLYSSEISKYSGVIGNSIAGFLRSFFYGNSVI